MCGEQGSENLPFSLRAGSSPRVRGAAVWAYTVSGISGIIPACAGSSTSSSSDKNSRRDHPRVCGEQHRTTVCIRHTQGSSPRVRGAGHGSERYERPRGIIPACAGSRAIPLSAMRCGRDHPRVCGEQLSAVLSGSKLLGSSPRVRGAGRHLQALGFHPGIIPACAGSRRYVLFNLCSPWDHPRVCGEQT